MDDSTTSGGRLLSHIFGALAELGRGLIWERTQAGLAAARARARHKPTVEQDQTPPNSVRLLIQIDTVDLGVPAECLRISSHAPAPLQHLKIGAVYPELQGMRAA